MAEELLVKCKGCYRPFSVSDEIDRATFETADIPTTSHRCPHCRIRRPYDKGDYFFGSPGDDPSPLDDLLGPG
ncbi:MAG: hypothetical protein M3314_01275 [Actinomycetota bacterium]|jgi:hypothetical protein|nr:hypothetical protein [Actinomycetota bacterium]